MSISPMAHCKMHPLKTSLYRCITSYAESQRSLVFSNKTENHHNPVSFHLQALFNDKMKLLKFFQAMQIQSSI